MASALLVGVLAFTLTYLYLLERRYRLAVLEDGLEEREVQAAIAERRAEAEADAGAVPVGTER
jgi:hypothetical protein